ncbi:MAG: M23 family metallopeptidase [Actinomycetota bacterium]|nr:M23 family metallopeptidase [Actinomycetota bacterium]
MIGLAIAALAAQCLLPPVAAPVAVPFVQPACQYCPGHRGLEYHLPERTAVTAAAAGQVAFAGSVAGTRYVVVRHADGVRATYGMLATLPLTRGDVVAAGAVVGHSTARLYFGLRNPDGSPLDPTALIGRLVGRARLVPVDRTAARPAGPTRLECRVSVTTAARPP